MGKRELSLLKLQVLRGEIWRTSREVWNIFAFFKNELKQKRALHPLPLGIGPLSYGKTGAAIVRKRWGSRFGRGKRTVHPVDHRETARKEKRCTLLCRERNPVFQQVPRFESGSGRCFCRADAESLSLGLPKRRDSNACIRYQICYLWPRSEKMFSRAVLVNFFHSGCLVVARK